MLPGLVQVECGRCGRVFGACNAAYSVDAAGQPERVVVSADDQMWILLVTRGHAGPVTGQLLRRVSGSPSG